MREILIAFFKTGSGSFLSLLFGILTTKIFAINIGPSGIGLYSVLRQIRDTLLTITTFQGSTALVQGIASREDKDRDIYVFTVALIVSISSILIVLSLLIFAPLIASYTLDQTDELSVWLIRALALPLVFSTAIMFLGGVINGYRAVGRLAIVQLVSSLITLIVAFPITRLINQGYLQAFVLMMTISTSLSAGIAFYFTKIEGWLPSGKALIGEISKKDLKNPATHFLSFGTTTLIAGFAATWVLLTVRSIIVSEQGFAGAGIFDVAWTLSMMYLTLLLSSFSTYYLPTLSQGTSRESKNILITRVIRLALLITVPLITGVIVLKPFLIQILYSEDFLPALLIIRWMLIGGYLKSTSWVFGVTIKAAADKKALFWSEILWQIGFLGLSLVSLYYFNNLEGVGIAFVFAYIIHLLFTLYYALYRYDYQMSKYLVIRWFSGLAILLGSSFTNWTNKSVNWALAGVWFLIAAIYSWLSLNTSDRKRLYLFVGRIVQILRGNHRVK